MRLTDYLTEAVAKRSSGKYFDYSSIDIRSMDCDTLVDALNHNHSIPKMGETESIMVISLLNIDENAEAMREIINASNGSAFMWSEDYKTPRLKALYFYSIEKKSVTVRRLVFGTTGPILCTVTQLPSGNKKQSNGIRGCVEEIESEIKRLSE